MGSRDASPTGGLLIQAKLRPRVSGAPALLRATVLERLEEPPVPRLTLLSAPAGYGKTTTARQWWVSLKARGLRAAWFSVDHHDEDPALFLSYLISSLADAGLEMGDLLTAARARLTDTPVSTILPLVIHRICEEPGPVFVFVDDYHLASPSAVDAMMAELLDYAGEGTHFIVATRRRPALNIADLRARQSVREFGVAELRFNRQESLAYFGYQDETTGPLVEVSEGWPTALQLARIWLERRAVSPQPGRPPAFTGRSSDLADYLVEQVLSGLPEVLRGRLLRISLLDRFNGDLVNALCHCTDGWQTLEEIAARNLFLSSLDDEYCWFALHQLFREFLHERLRRDPTVDLRVLYQRAVAWHEARGNVLDALQLSRRSDDPALLADVLSHAGGWCLALHKGIHVLQPIMSMSPAVAVAHPTIGLAQVYGLLQSGEIVGARRLFDEIADAARRAEPASNRLSISLGFMEHVLQLYEDRPFSKQSIARLQADLARSDEPFPERDLALTFRSYACHHHAEYEECIAIGKDALERLSEGKAYYAAFFLLCYMGLSHLAVGRLSDAVRMFEEGKRLASNHYSVHSSQVAIANVLLAEVAYERNELDQARRLITPSFDDIRSSGGWSDVAVAEFSTRTSLLQLDGRLNEALELLDAGVAFARNRRWPRLQDALLIQRLRLLVRAGRIEEAFELLQEPDVERLVGSSVEDGRELQLRESASLLTAQLLATRGRIAEAIELTAPIVSSADERGQGQRPIHARIVLARLQARAGEHADAMQVMAEALQKGRAQEMVRSFLDEGAEVLELIRNVIEKSDNTEAAEWGRRIVQASGAASATKDLARVPRSPAGTDCILSPREHAVLRLLADGLSTKEMARSLDLSEGTVKVHRKRLYRKLRVHNRSGALAVARSQSLLR